MSILALVAQAPKTLRYMVWPATWRVSIVAVCVWKRTRIVEILPYDLARHDLSGMYYAVSAVYGVVAGFIITAITIVASRDSEYVRAMLQGAHTSVPVKLLWAVITLFTFSLVLATLGPISNEIVPLSLFVGSTCVVALELLLTTFLIFLAMTPRGK